MAETNTNKRRTAVFLFVFLLHGFFIGALIRDSKPSRLGKNNPSEALLVYFLPRVAPVVSDAPNKSPSQFPGRGSVPKIRTNPDLAATGSIAPPIETAVTTPQIDWQRELEMAAQNRAAEADKNQYRDLAKSLSPSQLDWLRQHRMEPAHPGITWQRPRVEITKDGLPIVHINDHCVLVPVFLLPMVFCGIGHIEPNADLFKHMHDPPPL